MRRTIMDQFSGNHRFLALLIALGLFVCLASASKAADPAFNNAIQALQTKRYAEALSGFQQFAQKNPSDIQSHYYMGLCYQAMNQMSLAKQQYQWVAYYSRDINLKGKAATALGQLNQLASSSAERSKMASSAGGVPVANGASSQKLNGRLKVLEFYTTWCHVCQGFEPTWNRVSSKFSRNVDFHRFDAENPANAELVEKYHVTHYPTFVYTDNTGAPLLQYSAVPGEVGMVNDIHRFVVE